MRRCNRCAEPLSAGPICPRCGHNNRSSQNIPYALPPGSVLRGKYWIGNVLGQGGFGITYLGFDLLLEVKVAIKEYYISSRSSRAGNGDPTVYWLSDPGDMDHFITEARRMARLVNIPEVARVHDVFFQNQTAYIVMEFVEGESLLNYLKRNGPMDYARTIEMMLPIIRALGRVHAAGVIHRDISPDNLMLQPDGKLRLLDLGAAGDLTRNNSHATQMVARNGFSPYEQYMESGKIGPHTDIYAVCATICYCCTGRLIPGAVERMEQYVLSGNADVPLDDRIPASGVKVLQQGLRIDISQRFQSMDELAAQLEKTVKRHWTAPISPRPDSPPGPAPRRESVPVSQEGTPILRKSATPSSAAPKPVVKKAPDAPETAAIPQPVKIRKHWSSRSKWMAAAGAAVLVLLAMGAFFLSSRPRSNRGISTYIALSAEVPPEEVVSFTYEENETGLTITGYTGDLPSALTIPEKIDWQKVTAIGDYAFRMCSEITSISIPQSVITIGRYAFTNCRSLRSVVLPDSVTELGQSAFYCCDALTTVTLSENLAAIPESLFWGCKELTSITIPENVTRIGSLAFGGCAKLRTANLPDGKRISIEDMAFPSGCTILYYY